MIPVGLRLVGRGPFGKVPPAIFWIVASCAGLGLGKPSSVGILNGTAATLATAAETVKMEERNIFENFGRTNALD